MLPRAARSTAKGLYTLLTVASLSLSGCAFVDLANPKSPIIKLESVSPKSIGSAVQSLQIGLSVENPNRFDLNIQEINFTALVSGEKFARGNSNQAVKIPALGEALLDVEVELGLTDLLSQASKWFTSSEKGPIQYGITGAVTLENWPNDIPFNVSREISSPLQ